MQSRVRELKDKEGNVAALDKFNDPLEALRTVYLDEEPDSQHLYDKEVQRVPQDVEQGYLEKV